MKRLIPALAALAAWLPSLQLHTPVADEYGFRQLTLSTYFNEYGFWRIIGHLIPIYFPSHVFILTLHILAVLALYETARKLTSEYQAFIASLLFAACPFGYVAILWPAAATYVLSTLLFWLNLYILLSPWPERRIYALSFLCVFLSVLTNEALMIACLVSGVICLPNWKRGVPGILAVGVYLILYKIHGQHLKPIEPHWQSAFSPWAYQPKNLLIFGAWLHRPLTNVLGAQFGLLHLLGLLLLAFSVLMLMKVKAEASARGSIYPIIVLMLAASSIYALTGFTIDSRKQYPLMPLLMLFISMLFSKLLRPSVLVPILMAFTLQAWMMTALWKYEAERAPIVFEGRGVPSLYVEWPHLVTTFGVQTDAEWVQELYSYNSLK